jgi:hypothetical protein
LVEQELCEGHAATWSTDRGVVLGALLRCYDSNFCFTPD